MPRGKAYRNTKTPEELAMAFQIKPRPLEQKRVQRVTDRGYLDWLKHRPCDVCGKYRKGWMDPAHLGSRNKGIAQKANDCDAITLCRRCHSQQHAVGEKRFFRDLDIDPIALQTRVRQIYVRQPARSTSIDLPKPPKEDQ